LFLEPVGDFVALHTDVFIEVDHRLHSDLGVGVGAPSLDLVGGEDLAVVLDAGQVETVAGPGDGCFAQVDVEDDLAWLHGSSASATGI